MDNCRSRMDDGECAVNKCVDKLIRRTKRLDTALRSSNEQLTNNVDHFREVTDDADVNEKYGYCLAR